MPSANQLFLLADHIKLSLLERKRAQSLDIDAGSKDGAISQSLDQFRDGLTALDQEQKRLEEAGDEEGALTIGDNLPGLKQQYDDLTAQFHGFSSTTTQSTLTHPNDPTLASDFDHATTLPKPGSSAGGASRPKAGQRNSSKTVRFSDNPSASGPQSSSDPELEAQLFGNRRYRDEPDNEGYRDEADDMTNTQIHAYHQQIMDQQDQQLDALGTSIARQRELSMQIGDELDDQVAMLDDVDEAVDRHQGRIDRARGHVGRITRSASDNKQLMAIVILIIVLILLIALIK
ncbi:T-complex protein 1 subunit beta [Apiospora aurea]|uniref:T-complex protein 1 subunit beta n=1 Tax=Apiospora aurea TaxID=335848 RepID=A0ABR1Q971_9PEZI